jgi:hypothetical protein
LRDQALTIAKQDAEKAHVELEPYRVTIKREGGLQAHRCEPGRRRPPLHHRYVKRSHKVETLRAVICSTFTGRESNPLDRYGRCQLVFTIIPLPCSPDATGCRGASRVAGEPRRGRAAHPGYVLLRQKIEDDVEQPQYILTETGIGYRLRSPD